MLRQDRCCSGALSDRLHWPAEAPRHGPSRAQAVALSREKSPRDSACPEPAALVLLRPRGQQKAGAGALE